MTDLLGFTIRDIQVFVLLLTRIGTVFTVAPIFGSPTVEPKIKAAITLVITMVLFPLADKTHVGDLGNTMWGFLPLVVSEFFIGFAIGFGCRLFFQAIEFAGFLFSQEIGLSVAQMFNPEFGQIPVLAQFFVLFTSVLFLSADMHHWMLQSFWDSYRAVPLASVDFKGPFFDHFVRMTAQVLTVGFTIAGPVYACMFLITIVLGIMARVLPTLNIFMVGFSAKTMAGLFVLYLFVEIYAVAFGKLFGGFRNDVETLIRLMGPGV
jgi:flagellar biosynthetic protein FliR